MKSKYLKNALANAINRWEISNSKNGESFVISLFIYWREDQVRKVNKCFKNYKIKFIRTDNPVFPNQIRVTKK